MPSAGSGGSSIRPWSPPILTPESTISTGAAKLGNTAETIAYLGERFYALTVHKFVGNEMPLRLRFNVNDCAPALPR